MMKLNGIIMLNYEKYLLIVYQIQKQMIENFFCCHDDLNLYFHSFEEIECIVRLTDVPSTRLFYDLLWSDDPNKDTSEWEENDRSISLFIFSTEIIT